MGCLETGSEAGRYEADFSESAIDADILRDLTDQDLEKLGVVLGDRRRLLRAIAVLDDTPSPARLAPGPTSRYVRTDIRCSSRPRGDL